MKKIISIILAFIVAFSVFPLNFIANSATGSIFTYSISNGKVTITGMINNYNLVNQSFRIPSSIENCTVTSIAAKAFYGYTRLTGISIPNTVTVIGASAFERCSSLTSIIIPNSVKTIGSYAFRDSALNSISIGSSVTSIGDCAFDCSLRTDIAVNKNNNIFHSVDNCLIKTEEKTLILGSNSSIIPSDGSVTSIGAYAFHKIGFRSIKIPDSITSIGDRAFYECNSLYSITIPNSVTSIGEYAFASCTNLNSVILANSVIAIGGYAFSWCNSLKTIYYCGTQEQRKSFPGITDSVEILYHNFCDLQTVSYPTCLDEGIESRICAICGLEETRNIYPLGHDFENGICTRCGFYERPIFVSKTDTSITLQAAYGFEYSNDGENWQESNIFTGLTQDTVYTFYMRFISQENDISEALTVKTKASSKTPEPPELASITDDTVKLCWYYGLEYSIDGVMWQDDRIFNNLTPDTTYTFYQRVKETDDLCRSDASATSFTTKKRVISVIDNKIEGAGRYVTVDITLKDNPGISTGRFIVEYDSNNLTLEKIVLGDALSDSFVQCNGNSVSFVSESNIVGDKTLLTLTFKINWKANAGDTYIFLSDTDTEFFNYSDDEVIMRGEPGVISVIQHTPGDITGDEIVDMRDASRLLKYLNHETIEVDQYALDINGDNEINGKDLVRLMKYLNHECSEENIY